MKKLLFGAMTVLALAGAGCAGGGNSAVSTSSSSGSSLAGAGAEGPRPSAKDADPAQEVNVNWVQQSYAEMDGNCPKYMAYMSTAIRATMTDCTAAFAAYKTYLPIDWSKVDVSADKKTVTVHTTDGSVFAQWILEADGAWYLNTKFWEK